MVLRYGAFMIWEKWGRGHGFNLYFPFERHYRIKPYDTKTIRLDGNIATHILKGLKRA